MPPPRSGSMSQQLLGWTLTRRQPLPSTTEGNEEVEWSIQEVARSVGVTSRTLRHYDAIGLFRPSRIGVNGTRYYDRDALTRLQRILLLRGLGLALPTIGEVLAERADTPSALRTHIGLLRQEQERIDRQIRAIERTLTALENESEITMTTMFDGFDPTAYREEVEERWGAIAYATSSAWWEAKSPEQRADWQRVQKELAAGWVALAASDADPEDHEAQALAKRHAAWLAEIPGTPATDPATRKAYILALAEMYAADPRFAANYGGVEGADFVRAALTAYAEARL